MIEHPSLFDEPEPLARVTQPRAGKHHRDPRPTELAAAINNAPRWGTQRCSVLGALVEAGQTGMTRWELVAHIGILMSSACGRLAELEEAGWAKRTGRERRQQTGQNGEVWYATSRGQRALRSARRRAEEKAARAS